MRPNERFDKIETIVDEVLERKVYLLIRRQKKMTSSGKQ